LSLTELAKAFALCATELEAQEFECGNRLLFKAMKAGLVKKNVNNGRLVEAYCLVFVQQ
jgi:hypothetical protein